MKPDKRQQDLIGYRGIRLEDCRTMEHVQAYEEDLPLFRRAADIIAEQERKRQGRLFGSER